MVGRLPGNQWGNSEQGSLPFAEGATIVRRLQACGAWRTADGPSFRYAAVRIAGADGPVSTLPLGVERGGTKDTKKALWWLQGL